jgi:hypothetical protein
MKKNQLEFTFFKQIFSLDAQPLDVAEGDSSVMVIVAGTVQVSKLQHIFHVLIDTTKL